MKTIRTRLLATTALSALAFYATHTSALADCQPDPATDGATVTCTGSDVDGFSSSASSITLNIASGATISSGPVPQAEPGTVIKITNDISLPGSTITNNGTIDLSASDVPATGVIAGIQTTTGSIDNAGTIELFTGNVAGAAPSTYGAVIDEAAVVGASILSSSATDIGTITNSGSVAITNSGPSSGAIGLSGGGTTQVFNTGTVSINQSGSQGIAIGVNAASDGSSIAGTLNVFMT